MLKKKWLFISFGFLFLLFFLFFGRDIQQWISNYQEENEWNKEQSPPEKNIKLGEVPKIDQILTKKDIVNELKQSPYFFGYNANGQYGAFLFYDDSEKGFQVQIIERSTNKPVYQLHIPEENPTKSDEMILAQEAMDIGYQIKTPPLALTWENKMKKTVNQDTWQFEVTREVAKHQLVISKKRSSEKWSYSLDLWEKNELAVKMYSHPLHPEIVTFLDQRPVTIQLSALTSKNSDQGKKNEADQWLYGDFYFILDQNLLMDEKGYMAVSGQGKNMTPFQKYLPKVDQWVYLDSSGKMQWYGNPEGIFDVEGKPIFKKENPFVYRLQMMEGGTPTELKAIYIDAIDKKTEKTVKTLILEWNKKELEMKKVG